MNDDTRISPKYNVAYWRNLRPSLTVGNDIKAWSDAIGVLKDRIESRFFEPIQRLRNASDSADLGFGFAMLTLDCLLIDTIQSFREGRIKGSEQSTSKAFLNFFRLSDSLNGEFRSRRIIVDEFFDAIRCGLMHDGETRQGWRVRKCDENKILEKSADGYILYRDNFHAAIQNEFHKYLQDLASGTNTLLQENFVKRMDAICGLATAEASVLYFAYGSNMNPERMLGRIKSAVPDGGARLSGYRLVFNKRSIDGTAKANIEHTDQNGYVLGCVYRIPKSDFGKLRDLEAGYIDTTVELDAKGKRVIAYTFIAEASSVFIGSPSKDYVDHILTGAKYLNLPTEYQESLLRYAGE